MAGSTDSADLCDDFLALSFFTLPSADAEMVTFATRFRLGLVAL
jgi:hypothetical protein